MAIIHVLDPHVADMIAAGEVVERPASVIKELMENAMDAGAKNITVEIQNGGATGIRVTDDGCGMAPEDACNCFLRHATSKLKDENGLEAITTLGFRGEALAAISSVSRISLITRREEDKSGMRVECVAGEIQSAREIGCPTGSVFYVRDLFFNTPARLKFLKSDRAEASACVNMALRVALGRPQISVRCIRDGKEEFFTAGDGRIDGAIYNLLGREFAKNMLEVACEGENVSVRGYVSSPAFGRGNRGAQFFFINGRTFRSASLQAAVEQAYKNTLLTGRYPACALYVTVAPGQVDVNVHPTKQEVKFSQEGRVFDVVYHGVQEALNRENCLETAPETDRERLLSPMKAAVRAHFGETASFPREDRSGINGEKVVNKATFRSGTQLRLSMNERQFSYVTAGTKEGTVPDLSPKAEAPERNEPANSRFAVSEKEEKIENWRVCGEVMNTYIVVDMGDRMLLIDKHAAHERMNFDRLKARQNDVMAQTLLRPEIWKPEAEIAEILERENKQLNRYGFVAEPFGEEEFILRAIPENTDPAMAISALEEICESLKKGETDLSRDEILRTIACKAAIKAGYDTDKEELRILAEKVVRGEIRYCPHGRPVSVVVTRKELDKHFKRIV